MSDAQLINTAEVKSLLIKITTEATSTTSPMSELLRLCIRLGNQLDNQELMQWAKSELTGYASKDDLPEYRIHHSQVLGNFIGFGGAQMFNRNLPESVIDKKHRWLFTNHLTEPISALEELSRGDDSGTLKAPWAGDVIAYYQDKFFEGYALAQAWRVISKSTIVGVIDNVRTRILEFALKIQAQLGSDFLGVDDDANIKKPSQDVVTQIFNNTISGGNVAIGSQENVTQSYSIVVPGDLGSLEKGLASVGVTPELIDDLKAALTKDEKSETQPGEATQGWLARTMIMVGKGTLSVASNTAGNVISSMLMRYLGLLP